MMMTIVTTDVEDIENIVLPLFMRDIRFVDNYVSKNKQKVNTQDKGGRTLLQIAAENGNDDIVKFLLENNARIDICDYIHQSPLHWSARNHQPRTTKVLLEHKADVECNTQGAMIRFCRLSMLRSLKHRTPLHFAAMCGKDAWESSKEVSQSLLDYHASPLASDELTRCAYDRALDFHNEPVVQLFEAEEEHWHKIKHEKNPSDGLRKPYDQKPTDQNDDYEGLLRIASYCRDENVVKNCIKKNELSINSLDKNGWSALHYAAQKGHISIVKKLLMWNAKIDITIAQNMRTPLHIAVLHHQTEVVSLLLKWEADYNIEDCFGHTAVYYAEKSNFRDISELMETKKEQESSLEPNIIHEIVVQRPQEESRANYSIPDPPCEVTAQPTSSKSIKVSWTLPQNISNRGAIEGYELRYSSFRSSTSVLNVGVTTCVEITGLKPYTTYNIFVRTRAAGLYSQDSSPCTVTTKEDTPSPPVDVCAEHITTTSMTITWRPPHEENGTIRGYQVSYTPHDESKCSHDTAGDITRTELTSLNPHIEYTIRVRAKTVEYGEYSNSIIERTCGDDERKSFTIINGKSGVFDLEDYGMTISFKCDSLPPNINECKLSITAHLTTDIPLPTGSLLVSGIYHIATMPFIDNFNQPVEISMEHCAIDFNNLCFVIAKDYGERKFEYLEGGTFTIDGRSIGKICVNSFCSLGLAKKLLTQWRQISRWFTDWSQVFGGFTGEGNTSNEQTIERTITYCGRLYYDDTESHRKVKFVITKDLALAEYQIAKQIEFKAANEMKVEFSELQATLELPEEEIGEGWQLLPLFTPTEISKQDVDSFDWGMLLPQVAFRIKWTRRDSNSTEHDQYITLHGTRKPQSILVNCISAAHTSASTPFTLQGNDESLKVKIRDADIDRVAGELPDWQIVMYNLGFGSQNITDIETDHRDKASQRIAFLSKWIARDGSEATYKKLCDALISLNRKGAAERISNIAQ